MSAGSRWPHCRLGRGQASMSRKRLVAAAVNPAEQRSARGIVGGAADGVSVDRFCQHPCEWARGRWASRRLRDRRRAGGSRQPVAGRQVIGRAFHAQHMASAPTGTPQKGLRIQWPNRVQLVTCPPSRPRRLLAQGTWGVATAAGCRRRPRGQPHLQGATTMRSHEILTGSSTG
jgi:hypothetical protein